MDLSLSHLTVILRGLTRLNGPKLNQPLCSVLVRGRRRKLVGHQAATKRVKQLGQRLLPQINAGARPKITSWTNIFYDFHTNRLSLAWRLRQELRFGR